MNENYTTTFKLFFKKDSSLLPSCQYTIHTPLFSLFSFNTQYVSYHTSQPFPFHPEAQIRRYSCYHAHTPFIDMTSITAWGRFASAQTANRVLLTLMKYPQSWAEAFSRVSRGGLCPVSIRSSLHRFMDASKGSQDNSIDLAPSPTSRFPPLSFT